MKRFLMITLTAITAVALVAAPVWAAGGRMLSDRQLDNVHAGADASADADAKAKAKARTSADTNIDAQSSAEATANYASTSKLAVKVNNQCGTSEQCKLKVETEAEGTGSVITTNAQSIANTLASVNAIQVNVGAGGSQSNMAFSAEGVVSKIDSAEFATGGVVGSSHSDGTSSGASNAVGATAGGSGNATANVTGTDSATVNLSNTSADPGNYNVSVQTQERVKAKAKSDADAASASSASSATTSASTSASSGGAFTSASAASALAFATPKVKINNQCGTINCKLKVETEAEYGGTVTTNAQSILNTLASVNAVQINVSSGTGTQSNIAFSTVK